MKWNSFDAIVQGAVGGAKTSDAKRRAAKQNGKRGGRPRQTTLAEHILRRKLTREEHQLVAEGFLRLSLSEQESFRKFFDLERMQTTLVGRRGKQKLKVAPYFKAHTTDGIRPSRASKRMQVILRKFRLTARYLLAVGRKA